MIKVLVVGLCLYMMEGYVKVVIKCFEFDVVKKMYFGEFLWFDSVEGIEYLYSFGVCDCFVCWM